MSPRRHHRKSRNGCNSCKVRHIKVRSERRSATLTRGSYPSCDEALPKCTFCSTRQLECSYVRVQKGSKDGSRYKHNPATKHDETALPTLNPGNDQPLMTSTRLLDARLLHHYSTLTCKSLVREGDARSLYRWQSILPSIAIGHGFVLDSLLSLSALHLAHLQPSQRHSWGKVALRYNSAASAELRNVIIRMSTSMIKPAFVCSSFILLGFLGQQKILANPDLRDPLSEVLQVRELLRGCMMLHASAKTASALPWAENSNNDTGDNEGSEDSRSSSPACPTNKWVKRLESIGTCIQKLTTVILEQADALLETSKSTMPQHLIDTYGHARLSLEPIINNSFPVQSGHDAMLMWPVMLQNAFIQALQEGDLIARLIFLPYAIWLHLGTGDVWIFSDLGLHLVQKLMKGKYEERMDEGVIELVTAAIVKYGLQHQFPCMGQ
ncbi:hypothetical protein BJX70DRAFT_401210 [Aspergillus crustosus]